MWRLLRNGFLSMVAAPLGLSTGAWAADPLVYGETAAYEVQPSSAGVIHGQVSVVASDTVRPADRMALLFMQDGRVVRHTVVQRGAFDVKGLEPGVYSVVASGADGLAAFGLKVLRSEQTLDFNAPVALVEEQFLLDFRTVPPADYELLRSTAVRAPRDAASVSPVSTEAEQPQSTQAVSQVVPGDGVTAPVKRSEVLIDRDGGFEGELVRFDASGDILPLDGASVLISKRGEIVAQTTTDSAGRFKVTGLEGGNYSLFGANAKGLVAISFVAQSEEAIEEAPQAEEASADADNAIADAMQPVAALLQESAGLPFQAAAIDQAAFQALPQLAPNYAASLSGMAPFGGIGGGAFGGGGIGAAAGGGAAGAGSGLLGSLLGAAAGVAAGIAASEADSSSDAAPPPASSGSFTQQ